MKMSVRMAVLTVSMLGLAACASSGGTTSYSAKPQSQPQTRMSNNEAYMARIEAYDRRRGIDLTWVNPPREIVAKDE
jgi:ABC-type glycerol-3-phosphate transport system substrate-binding protein